MKVQISKALDPVSRLEIGVSTWDETKMSIRLRFDKKNRFDVRSSSEIPLSHLVEIVVYAIENNQMKDGDLLKIIEAANAGLKP